ncbi:MAG: ABC transporter permease [Bacteroidota bacterium]
MRALAKKRWRDLWSLRGPAAAIALVLACGVVVFVASAGMLDALRTSQAAFYRAERFADVFASAARAPEAVRTRIEAIPGVSVVDTRVKAMAKLEVPGYTEPVSGLFVSLPETGRPALNGVHLRAGRLPDPLRADEVVVSDAFAEAQGLRTGSTIAAILNGRRQPLTIVGLALAPEFVYQITPGAVFPDVERFAIVWMRRPALAAAYDYAGAFNDVALTLAPGADAEAVLARLDALLDPYGGTNAIAREDQPSHYFLSEEFRQLEQSATILPALFLAVAAFLLSVVVTRLVQTQREEIATLKAFGYSTAEVGRHYAGLVLVIALLGALVGVVVGLWAGRGLGEMYLEFYRFPTLIYEARLGTALFAAVLTVAIALAGTARAVAQAVRLPPAEAMRPPPPPRYHTSFVERLGLGRWLGAQDRMILRSLERRPGRALLSAIGIAMACAIVLLGRTSGDAIDLILDVQFDRAHREDVQVMFVEPRAARAGLELERLPGVRHVEPFRMVSAELRRAHRTYDAGITGMAARGDLARVLDAELVPVALPPEGLVLSAFIADYFSVAVGDTLTVAVQEGAQPVWTVPVGRVVHEFIGAGVYMERRALNRLLGEGDVLSGAWLAADAEALPALYDALRERPVVLSATALYDARASLEETFAENLLVFTLILSGFAAAIAFGVVYNTARLSLAERGRELASLRVLGFTRGEVAYLFFGELAVLVLMSLPLGLALGTGFCTLYIDALQTEFFRMPFVLTRGSYAFVALVIVGAAAVSALVVSRKLHRLDLIAVLKTRE